MTISFTFKIGDEVVVRSNEYEKDPLTGTIVRFDDFNGKARPTALPVVKSDVDGAEYICFGIMVHKTYIDSIPNFMECSNETQWDILSRLLGL